MHVYGQIDKIQLEGGHQYGKECTLDELEKLRDNIRVIYERTNSMDNKTINGLISKAKRIFFLGFGYAPENLEALDISGPFSAHHQIFGTAYHFSDRQKSETLKNLGFGPSNESRAKLIDTDCLTLLERYL